MDLLAQVEVAHFGGNHHLAGLIFAARNLPRAQGIVLLVRRGGRNVFEDPQQVGQQDQELWHKLDGPALEEAQPRVRPKPVSIMS